MDKLEEIQNRILELWENADEDISTDMYIGWVGWDFIGQDFIDRIKNYDNIVVLGDFLKDIEIKKEFKEMRGGVV